MSAAIYNNNDDDDDSEDDDDLLFQQSSALFQRRSSSRAETKKKAQRQSLLDAALQEAENNFASQLRIQQWRANNSTMDSNGKYCNDDDDDVPSYEEVLAATQKVKSEQEDEGVFDAETQTLREKALQHDCVERVGRRHTILFQSSVAAANNNKNDNIIPFFESQSQALAELQGIVKQLPKNQSKLQKKLQFAIDYDLVHDCLLTLDWSNRDTVDDDNDATRMPLTTWLWSVACSAGLWERHWGDAARQVLEQTTILLPMPPQQHNNNNNKHDVKHLLSLLKCWNADQYPCTTARDNTEDTEMAEEEIVKDSSEEKPAAKNIDGLVNCLLLWEKIIPSCQQDESSTRQCLQLLVRFGLDVDFERRDVLGRVLAALLVAANLESNVTETASLMLEGLTELGPGLTEDDAEDTGAWLVLTEAVRLVSIYRPTATPPAVLRLHAALAQSASDICLQECNLPNQLLRLNEDHPSLATLVQHDPCCQPLVTVCAGLQALIHLSDAEIARDPPRLEAGVECLFAMFQSAMLLLEHETANSEDTATTTTTALAKISRHYFVVLDPLLVSLSRRLRPMVTTSHIRRSDMLLQLWHQYNIVMHRQASVTQQQKTMDSFFKPMTPSPAKRGSPLRT